VSHLAAKLTVGGEEEREDVLKAYEMGKGSVQYVLEHVMACTIDDQERFVAVVDKAIEEGEVETFARWKRDTTDKAMSQRRKAAEKEAKEADELSKELGLKKSANKMSHAELGDLILQRSQNRMNGLIEKLESEAAKSSKRKEPKRKEPTEEEFAATQSRLTNKSKKRK
jgi:DnaJ homolog subfamily C member 9